MKITERQKNESILKYYCRLKNDFDLDRPEIYYLLFGEQVSSDHARKAFKVIDMILEDGYDESDDNIISGINILNKNTIEINKDGSQSFSKLIQMTEKESKDTKFLLKAHGYSEDEWDLIKSKSVFRKSLEEKDLYFSQIIVKPKEIEWSIESIDKYFETKVFNRFNHIYTPTNYDPNGEILEITLPDLHSGLLSFNGETGNGNYDIKIAKESFYQCLSDILERMQGRKFKKIYFVPLGDLLHADTLAGTTSKGTLQDCDGRFSKMFDNTLDMIIDGISTLSQFSKVEIPYIAGNHDKLNGYSLMKAVEQAFRNDDNVIVDTSPNPRKYRKEGNVLIGWTHGDMPRQNISEWLQVEARKEFGECKYVEVHTGHIHSQNTIERSGMIIRHLPTICPSSAWEHSMGYNKSVKTIVSFVWNPNNGLREMWFSNI